jgi:hypothetical protein
MPQPSRLHYLLLLYLPLSFPAATLADQDTNLRLNQSIEYRANRQERELLKDEAAGTTLIIDGQAYRVGTTSTTSAAHSMCRCSASNGPMWWRSAPAT